MKRWRRVFRLTVPEQRVIIALLLGWILYLAYVSYRSANHPPPTLDAQPSPSPGIRP